MAVLVDTSVWIDYFRTGHKAAKLDDLIDENIIVTNDFILAELIPFLKLKRQAKVVKLLSEIDRLPLQIDWDDIMATQLKFLKTTVPRISRNLTRSSSSSKMASQRSPRDVTW